MNTLTSKLRSRKNMPIGQIEQVILLAILHRENRAYGIEISEEIENRISVQLTVGALYSTLDRMVNKGLIEYSDSEAANNSQRSRKYFSVTSRGRQLLHESIQLAEKMLSGLDIVGIPVVV